MEPTERPSPNEWTVTCSYINQQSIVYVVIDGKSQRSWLQLHKRLFFRLQNMDICYIRNRDIYMTTPKVMFWKIMSDSIIMDLDVFTDAQVNDSQLYQR